DQNHQYRHLADIQPGQEAREHAGAIDDRVEPLRHVALRHVDVRMRDDEIVDRVIDAEADQQRGQFDRSQAEHDQQGYGERGIAGEADPFHQDFALISARRSWMRLRRDSSSSSASCAAFWSLAPRVPAIPIWRWKMRSKASVALSARACAESFAEAGLDGEVAEFDGSMALR